MSPTNRFGSGANNGVGGATALRDRLVEFAARKQQFEDDGVGVDGDGLTQRIRSLLLIAPRVSRARNRGVFGAIVRWIVPDNHFICVVCQPSLDIDAFYSALKRVYYLLEYGYPDPGNDVELEHQMYTSAMFGGTSCDH